MDLSNIALTKIDRSRPFYAELLNASPDKQFTFEDQIRVSFEKPKLKTPSGPNREEERKLNLEKLLEAANKVRQKLETIKGLTINSALGAVGMLTVSGSAKAMVEMLELPEVKSADSKKYDEAIVVIQATGQTR